MARLRLHVDEIYRDEAMAKRIESALNLHDGVRHVSANPLTGNVLVTFRKRMLSQDEVVASIIAFNFTASPRKSVSGLGQVSVRAAMSTAFQGHVLMWFFLNLGLAGASVLKAPGLAKGKRLLSSHSYCN